MDIFPIVLEDPGMRGCIDCGAQALYYDVCQACGIDQNELLARVDHLCGDPPDLQAIVDLFERGLIRVAFNALNWRLVDPPDEPPDEPTTLVTKATLLLDLFQLGPALALLRRAVGLSLDPHADPLLLGRALLEGGWPDAAMRMYAYLITFETERARRARMLLGFAELLIRIDDREEAERCFARALELDPSLAERVPGDPGERQSLEWLEHEEWLWER